MEEKNTISSYIKRIESDNADNLSDLCHEIMNFIKNDSILYAEFLNRVKQFKKYKKQDEFKNNINIICDYAQLLQTKEGNDNDLFCSDGREDLNYCDLVINFRKTLDIKNPKVTDWKIIKEGIFQYYYTLITYAALEICPREESVEYTSSILKLKNKLQQYADFYYVYTYGTGYDWDFAIPQLKILLKIALKNVLQQLKYFLELRYKKTLKQDLQEKRYKKKVKIKGIINIDICKNSKNFSVYFDDEIISFTKSEYKIINDICYGGIRKANQITTSSQKVRTMVSNINKKVKNHFNYRFIVPNNNRSYKINEDEYKYNID